MENNAAFERLLHIMDDLREKCPWDKKQTIHTLRQQTIEELYELVDAITDEDWKSMKEELGDLLLHIVFYSKIGTEQQQFTIEDVINGVCEKLITRHPHIYGDVKVDNEEQVKQNWEKIKLKEGKTSVLSGVPKALPALVKAMRLQGKAKQVGFEWENSRQVWDKVKEEMDELQEMVEKGTEKDIEAEFGDVLFSLINYSRFLHIDAENALERTNKKFIRRFQYIEKMATEKGKSLDEMSLVEMDELWNEAKKTE
ncbi:XTP/dITP diphosphohydrolase [Chitinophaga sp. YR573]|uniref:nucleoside triphosphate pyrophosphohydrolase n=1 Tax=Chitinophaga sp. YR573 TaxID=1881040 RepID=UPI0008C117C8|nr:nucleoside triphosphate pyrophosphohydrolase [Chitinophaga sp. YR573]SEV91481.1 XTP/dITP diphosphohydrolase [Chitinophaga sp. YR573]